MAFHESFWIATSAVAPVIALAAVVALTDALTLVGRISILESTLKERSEGDPWLQNYLARRAQDTRKGAWAAGLTTLVNLIIQAALLAVSLSALAYDQDIMPLWLAVTLATGGILLLAWAALLSAIQRWTLEVGLFRKGSAGDPEPAPGDSTANES